MKYDRIYKLTSEAGRARYRIGRAEGEKLLKKLEKSFEKGIDKAEPMWYNRKVGTPMARRQMIFEN
ncbi:MAG: hypothetical protein IKJ35_08965 [Clostridia bacterium]|nr:hypothetical protein [Clostridia bacterium]